MSTSTTLPTGPLEHLAMDYAGLRERGLRLLERLAGAQWTDFNAHDPGITILEQLCYAITDLGYRINHPVADLIAGSDPAVALPGPAEILTCAPVTQADLRRQLLDIEGVANAWVEPLRAPSPPFYHLQGSDELHLQRDPGDPTAQPVQLAGLHHVLLQTSDRLSAEQALTCAAASLHRRRGLGEDYQLALLTSHEVWIQAKIEVGPIDQPADVLAEIIEQIEAYLAPPVRFTSRGDAADQGRSQDELYTGPYLDHGFVLGELPPLRAAVRASDLIHAIMNVPAVRAVRSLALATAAAAPRERWLLEIPAGQVPTLATSSELCLLRAGLPVRVDPAELQARLAARRLAAHAHRRSDAPHGQPPPRGRDRQLAHYRSILHQFPAAYGVGALGLPDRAPVERRAQARQLAAYLHLFDQLLANQFAQLANAHRLLSPEEAPLRTYFAQPIDDPRLRVDELLRHAPRVHRAWLAGAVEPGDDASARRSRFLAHLLARYAEHLGDHAHVGDSGSPRRSDADLVADRQAFLRDYPRLSRARGSGHDIFGDDQERSGLAQRLRLRLGLGERPRLHIVEHLLLRPIPEDARQIGDDADPRVPLLAGVHEPDPWSFQVSYVFEALPGDQPGGAFEQMVAQTILAETPAHLRPHLHWFGDDHTGAHWSDFDAAWAAFRAAHRAYRAASLHARRRPRAAPHPPPRRPRSRHRPLGVRPHLPAARPPPPASPHRRPWRRRRDHDRPQPARRDLQPTRPPQRRRDQPGRPPDRARGHRRDHRAARPSWPRGHQLPDPRREARRSRRGPATSSSLAARPGKRRPRRRSRPRRRPPRPPPARPQRRRPQPRRSARRPLRRRRRGRAARQPGGRHLPAPRRRRSRPRPLARPRRRHLRRDRPAHRPALRGPRSARPRQQGRRRPGSARAAQRAPRRRPLAADRGQPSRHRRAAPRRDPPPRRRAQPAPARQPTERPLPRLAAADPRRRISLRRPPRRPHPRSRARRRPANPRPAARHHPLGGAPAAR
ncbi:MAG: hypothetical protein IPK80_03850 [Nannocystis sp.]|nr:hypothetical protein [Nannocystis sp.]